MKIIKLDKELFEYYDNHSVGGIPLLNEKEFKYVTDTYGKDLARSTLANYIANSDTQYPITGTDHVGMIKTFHKLRMSDYSKTLTPSDELNPDDIVEKHEYKYTFKDYGLGLIDAHSIFNPASGYFMNKERIECSVPTRLSPADIWRSTNPKDTWDCFGALWRGVNKCHYDDDGKVISGEINIQSYLVAMRLGSYVATQFKPNVARSVYEMTKADKVLDTSMGWGDRMCGFMASNAKEYIGCDPNPNTFKIYKTMAVEYSKLIGDKILDIVDEEHYYKQIGTKKVLTFYRSGAEDIPWEDINEIDCAFTSPPYFSTELYNEGGEHEDDQSWSKFSEYNSWRDNFYLPVSKNSFNALSDRGFLMINIMDPTSKGERYYSCDELVDSLKDNFIGQIGMRIMQRPHGKSKFTPEELREYLKKTYMENVWVFSKGNGLDLFRDARTSTLESFFN